MWKVTSPMCEPAGHGLYAKRADAVAAARQEEGCGTRAGMRAVRVKIKEFKK